MIVRDELNRRLNFPSDEIIKILQDIILIKNQEMKELKNKIKKYEEKKRAEETFYRSLSPVRKFFASRPPSHHQAVEYMVHVKERLKQIDTIKQRVLELEHAIQWCKERLTEKEIELSSAITEEIMKYRKGKDY